ncbi:MAG: type IV secretory system conjugative DNA transfer family protein [Lachnospiraceae bacterium]|nr:type IV secretory system conjugative DNA transfer family protein [Ruminococcus sp.]MCM1274064.1 type IV secretory system conjugative DNA transfer family protein [Lachnospiraceae bacterium]
MTNERILAKGVSVSNDTVSTRLNNNDLIIGSSGAGKTGGYVIPNLQNISGSMVVSDTKGQLARMFTDELKEKGYDVVTLDFVNPERSSCGYNPLAFIERGENGGYSEKDVLTLANNLVPLMTYNDPFWDMSAQSYVVFLIAFCLDALPPEEQNMMSVCEAHRRFIQPNGDLSFIRWAEDNPDTFAAKRFRQLTGIRTVERTWSCIIEFANRALEMFDFKEGEMIFGELESFDIASLGKRKTVLFLNVSDTDGTFDKIINIFYSQALQTLCSVADDNPGGKLEIPVRIIMDDFAASAKLNEFDRIISVIRSREVSVSIILQSMTQLESMYNHSEATTIINNCDHIIYLGSQDYETAQFIGRRTNRLPENILTLSRDKLILVTNGEVAREYDKIAPYSTLSK